MKTDEIEISIGILQEKSSYICLERNTAPYENFIEFPGGKRHSNESISSCLVRELKEELNISLKKYKYIGFIKHLYNDVLIKINIFKIFQYDGKISSNENRDIVLYKENSVHALLPTHMRILSTLRTPRLFKIVTIEKFSDNNKLDLSIYRYLRLRGISYDLYKKKIKEKIQNANFSGEIIIDHPFELSWQDKYYGIHYKSTDITKFEDENRKSNYTYSASCHTIDDIKECNKRLFDFVLISPLLETHNEFNILGWSNFRELSLQSYCPSLALGGLSASKHDFADCIRNYGFGIAGVKQI